MKPGYKQTEVGAIPEDWKECYLQDLVDSSNPITYGVLKPGDYIPNGIPLLQIKDVIHGNIDPTQLHRIGTQLDGQYSRTRLVGEEIVVSLVGTIGRVAQIPKLLAGGNLHRNLARIFVSENHSSRFVFYYLSSERIQRVIKLTTFGSTQSLLNLSDLRKLPIAIPLLSEQRAIAGALSDVDALIGALDQLIAKKRDLKQAAMQQLLTGQTRLKGFGPTRAFKTTAYCSIPDDWDVKPFKLASSMNGRIGWQGLKQEEFTESPDDPYLITGMNFKDGKIRWNEVYHIPAKRYQEAPAIQLQVDDILMTKDGTIGKLLYVDFIPHPGMASLNSHLLVFRPILAQYVPKFLFYLLNSPTFAQHIELHKSGSTFFGLTQEATGKYPVILPAVPEQAAIAEVLSDMDAELGTLEQRRDKTRALKQGMMQELLTGRIRLIN